MQSDGTAEYSLAYIWDHNKFRNVSGQLAFLDYLTPYLAPGVRILDVGCGLGTLSIALAQKDPDCEVYAIDISEEQIEIAKAQAQERGVGNVRFSVADVLDIPFEDGYFDIVHGNDVLAWIPDTAAALAQIKRVLKTGGSVAFREMIMEGSFGYPLGSSDGVAGMSSWT